MYLLIQTLGPLTRFHNKLHFANYLQSTIGPYLDLKILKYFHFYLFQLQRRPFYRVQFSIHHIHIYIQAFRFRYLLIP